MKRKKVRKEVDENEFFNSNSTTVTSKVEVPYLSILNTIQRVFADPTYWYYIDAFA